MNLKIFGGLGAVILILGTLLFLQRKQLKKVKMERDQAINYQLAKDDSIRYLETKLGQETAQVKVLDLTVSNLRKLQSDKDLAWIKEIKAVNKRMNNVEEIMAFKAHLEWKFNLALQDTLISLNPDDTLAAPINARKFDNQDKWIRLSGYILPDTIVIKPVVTVPLNSVIYWQRKKFLGLRICKKEYFQETTSPNPYVRITESKVVRVTKRK